MCLSLDEPMSVHLTPRPRPRLNTFTYTRITGRHSLVNVPGACSQLGALWLHLWGSSGDPLGQISRKVTHYISPGATDAL